MRSINIVTTKTEYLAGEPVEGHLIINTDKAFKCNAVHVTFTGREHTRVVVQQGEHSTTYTDERVYFKERQDLCGSEEFPVGETRFPFRFNIPLDIPSSYSGHRGWIEYSLSGVVELSFAIDPKKKVNISVTGDMEVSSHLTSAQKQTLEMDNSPVMDVEIEEDCVTLGTPLRFGVRVASNVETSGIRAELVAKESVVAKGHRASSMKRLAKWYISPSELPRDIWIYGTIDTDHTMPVSIEKTLLKNETFLKVTLERRLRLDKSIQIPVRLIRHHLVEHREQQSDYDRYWR